MGWTKWKTSKGKWAVKHGDSATRYFKAKKDADRYFNGHKPKKKSKLKLKAAKKKSSRSKNVRARGSAAAKKSLPKQMFDKGSPFNKGTWSVKKSKAKTR